MLSMLLFNGTIHAYAQENCLVNCSRSDPRVFVHCVRESIQTKFIANNEHLHRVDELARARAMHDSAFDF